MFVVYGAGGIVSHMIMPAITPGWVNVAALMRPTRSAMLKALYAYLDPRIRGNQRRVAAEII